MRKLIIGCGYVGLAVAREWVKQGHQVSALTRSENNAEKFIAAGIQPVLGDITQPESLERLPEADTVLYAVGFDRTADKSRREIYVTGLDSVLKVLKQRSQKVIYLSSTSVYGQTAGEWVDETSICEPERENGQICLEAEQLFDQHGFLSTAATQTKTATAVILRLAGIYGPGRLLARMEQINAGEPLAGRPDAWLNLIHLTDIIQTILRCDKNVHLDDRYLVCDCRPITRQEYYETLARLLKAPEPRFASAVPGENSSKSTRFNSTERASGLNKRCDNRRLREELGISLTFPTIAEGLPDAIENG
ncbi:SDR family oxidoreductase [Gimesia algae]|uniref:NAD dependent epimerase/dehydratase family protein n=1 Tax=Gimesia algae TaxID=2527971 RepID=A0A517VI76_9PLAN|nr:SDR family oxidoreductase [Gimesia algae]QDT92709.1 NAD dependent epimerase/dehydratase family protein [Gimesia algae]